MPDSAATPRPRATAPAGRGRAWKDAGVFGGIGAAAFGLSFWIQIRWLELAARLMGRDRIIFDEQPDWIRNLGATISMLPWAACVALLALAVLRRRWTPALAFAGAQVLGWTGVFGVVLLGPTLEDYTSRVAFDSAAWKAENGPGARGTRVHMVDALLREHPLVGMPRAQVDALLGVPPATAHFREYDYVCWLGAERGAFGIDSEWLVLKFDGEAVARALVVHD